MKILVTNDDGILAPGLWALVRALKRIGEVVVVAPDGERSAIGSAVTLRRPIRVEKVTPQVAGVVTYAIEGTPVDSVLLALGKLAKDNLDLVVSGVNHGLNLGDDVTISGTVAAALQGYLHGLPSLAISTERDRPAHFFETAAEFASLLARRINHNGLPVNVLLNVNLPDVPLSEIKGLEITHLATRSHTDSAEEQDDGHYKLVRYKIDKAPDDRTDVWAIDRGNISITALHPNLIQQPPPPIPESLYAGLLQELQDHTRH
ncbi:MAG: 5'/3'-nucleotidase SurE [Chloroflexota bacterium]|nr:5'/3'-nucleotidase SurE [Chloroflexota bacterium]